LCTVANAVRVGTSAVTDRRYSLARRADWRALAHGRQAERRAVPVRREIKEVILRIEELRRVVARAGATTRAEIAVRFDTRCLAARDVVRHQVDDRLEAVGMEALD